ncbi:MAG: hypothetical protein ACREK7_04300 [Gemmatimonadota bacterium]
MPMSDAELVDLVLEGRADAFEPEQRERFQRMQRDRRDVIIRRFVEPAEPAAP